MKNFPTLQNYWINSKLALVLFLDFGPGPLILISKVMWPFTAAWKATGEPHQLMILWPRLDGNYFYLDGRQLFLEFLLFQFLDSSFDVITVEFVEHDTADHRHQSDQQNYDDDHQRIYFFDGICKYRRNELVSGNLRLDIG